MSELNLTIANSCSHFLFINLETRQEESKNSYCHGLLHILFAYLLHHDDSMLLHTCLALASIYLNAASVYFSILAKTKAD